MRPAASLEDIATAPLLWADAAPTPQAEPELNPNAGHRERLRMRARKGGLGALPDYELLELFLFRSIPQGDVKPRAKALLTRFGSLAAVLAAPVEDLRAVKGIGPAVALDLAALHEVTLRAHREPV
eukprot:gene17236-17061_t